MGGRDGGRREGDCNSYRVQLDSSARGSAKAGHGSSSRTVCCHHKMFAAQVRSCKPGSCFLVIYNASIHG